MRIILDSENGSVTQDNTEKFAIEPETIGVVPASVLIFIDSVKGPEFYGAVRDLYSQTDVAFQGFADMVIKIDRLCSQQNAPQAFMRMRSWVQQKRVEDETGTRLVEMGKQNHGLPLWTSLNTRRGSVATFCISLYSRRQASWQGKVVWFNNRNTKVQYFRSVLELLYLISETLFPADGRRYGDVI